MSEQVSKRDYCGCCGRDIGPESGNISEPWCRDCRKHVKAWGPQFSRTFFALTGRECPYSFPRGAPATKPVRRRAK